MSPITITNQSETAVLGFISESKGIKNSGKFQARMNTFGNHRRNVDTIKQAWNWINKKSNRTAKSVTENY